MTTFAPVALNATVVSMLVDAGLPVSDLEGGGRKIFGGLHEKGELIGVVGIELYLPAGLLRSLAVVQSHRGLGYSSVLVSHAEQMAAKEGVTELFLLTGTAAPLFERCGYRHTSRVEAPESISRSQQFANICPGTAAFMVKHL